MDKDFPIEYRKGFTNFLGLKIDLSKRPLIPREETEFWVEQALEDIRENSFVLDIFSGSGCIGIVILKRVKNSRVDFSDIEKAAVDQIRINLKLNNVSSERYAVFQSDIFEKIKGKKYDYIFANPPYVAEEREDEVQPSVLRHEPQIAIFAGKKGLDVIRRFLKEARACLKEGGMIFMEFDPLQKADIESILIKEKYRKSEFKKDQFNQWRWLRLKA
ncbi:MAG: peptide chain release factor N(5)-glutamine methyltransferase [bacterium]|nr:peptide chain release factor N(5)-glutamine methyltransferase [bacterium]